MLGFVEERKSENPKKKKPLGASRARTNNKHNPNTAPGRSRAQATLVGGERSHTTSFPLPKLWFEKVDEV